jgi:hypothetical protein
MKTLLILSSCVAAAVATMAQGTVNFANYASGVNAPISDSQGNLLDSSYLVQLYAGTTQGSLSPVGSAIHISSTAGAEGYFMGGTVDTGLPGQSSAWLAVAAWSGSVASYDLAKSSTSAGVEYGMSPEFQLTLGGPGASGPPATPANLSGLQSFSTTVAIPEPSVLALGFLGAGLLFLRRRR